jgi:flagellar biosynthesis protein FlhF
MILQFGQPGGIELGGKKPKIVFFVGPTGVGKTTTVAKIASHYKVEQGRKLALLTSDTYRIAATEQLRIYANILDVPLTIIYTPAEVAQAVDSMSDYDVILVDTSGFSHKSMEQRDSTKMLLDSIGDKYNKEVFLVVSATTKYKDLKEIVDMYAGFTSYKLIFTKLDETSAYGNILNIRMYSNAEMSYTTNGQVVPDDIEVFNAQKIVKQLLGGRG